MKRKPCVDINRKVSKMVAGAIKDKVEMGNWQTPGETSIILEAHVVH